MWGDSPKLKIKKTQNKIQQQSTQHKVPVRSVRGSKNPLLLQPQGWGGDGWVGGPPTGTFQNPSLGFRTSPLKEAPAQAGNGRQGKELGHHFPGLSSPPPSSKGMEPICYFQLNPLPPSGQKKRRRRKRGKGRRGRRSRSDPHSKRLPAPSLVPLSNRGAGPG